MLPYLSIVVSSRNDDHGGKMQHRMAIFVRGLLHQTRKYGLPSELIFVEWNPPSNTPLLHEILPKPNPDDCLSLRYIIVPPHFHARYRFADTLSLHQMIAKNVGIRRARGRFVLCTNVDLLFSDALLQELAQQNLRETCFYRANRCDIPADLSPEWTVEEQLVYAQEHIGVRLGIPHAFKHLINAHPLLLKSPFIAAPLNALVGLKRRLFADKVRRRLWLLDLHACGDFTLMSRQAWDNIQGYPEIDLYPVHIDSLGIIAAAAAGYEQIIFEPQACTYHLAHQNSWNAMNPIERLRFCQKTPGLGWEVVESAGRHLLETESKWNINTNDWGLYNEPLQEILC